MTLLSHPELTFKHNMKRGRHGWLRLTPAYAESWVRNLLQQNPQVDRILEPFGGTGTTALVASELGRECDLFDINPFLIWLAQAKCANYTHEDIACTEAIGRELMTYAFDPQQACSVWIPPMNHIERWWDETTQLELSHLLNGLYRYAPTSSPTQDLLKVAFCQLVIETSNASFNHQSVSFKNVSATPPRPYRLHARFYDLLTNVLQTVQQPIHGRIRAVVSDSRTLHDATPQSYSAVITSPPYVNRMSYIRELRPYMYWLGYLVDARQAGELDWRAIGGTWGIATSRLNAWSAPHEVWLPDAVYQTVERIQQQSQTLANYVHKYFVDMGLHFSSVYPLLMNTGKLYYVVGNSKFYDTLVPVQTIYAELMQHHGFVCPSVEIIRKRSSKRELYEFLVMSHKES